MQTVSRLYESFQPSFYRLKLTLDRPGRTFSGTVTIDGHYSGSGPLRLHSKDLTISRVSLNDTELTDFHHGDNDELTVAADSVAGNCTVMIEFSGTITDQMHGLYPCYFEVDGEKQELLATQFESHHAREVFPCIDEPEAKAVFNLALETEPDVTVLSNMPSQTTTTEDTVTTTVFEPTPKMSPYLLAFVIGDLQKQSATTKDGVEVNVWATKAQNPASLAFPLETAVKTIDFFDDYFGVPYPLPKADHVALPDFSSGAMENWGLITYREVTLLVDDSSSLSMREYVATVIAHETSHQWFGNLVTMRWWDDLWLNESFATLMEHVAVDALNPGWHDWNNFASQEVLSALRRDQLAGVQAVKTTVNHPDEISVLFDPSIVYAKGARLLKMLRSYIGDDAFRRGLRTYFKQHAYQNTVGDDLWAAFSKSSDKDVATFMGKWLSQPGFPVVDVATTDDGYRLSQSRFVLGENAGDATWPIPLFAWHDQFPTLLEGHAATVTSEPGLPLLNRHNDAHFVTHYDEAAWQLVLNALRDGKLDTVERLALLHETSLLARGSKLSTAALLPLLKAYENETSEPVWGIMSMAIGDLKRFVEDDETSETHLKHLTARLAAHQYARLGFDQIKGESDEDTKLRALIISLLAYAEDDIVIGLGLNEFRSTNNLLALPSETRAVILGIAGRHGSAKDFDRLLDVHGTTPNAELREDIVSGLCLTRDHAHIDRLLARLTDNFKVKQQDIFRWFIYLLRNRHARDATWQWMVDNWDWIEHTFAGDKSYDDFARYSASILATRQWLKAYRTFFDPLRNITALKRAIDVGTTEITTRVEWLERDSADVKAALAQETT